MQTSGSKQPWPVSSTLRVFLSSTSRDLAPYRSRLASLVQHLGQFAVTMNGFPLQPTKDATAVSLAALQASSVYVLLLAWCYGTIPTGEALSVTHQEYREARRLGLPCFVFLADEQTDANSTLFPPAVRDPEHRTQLLAFRAEVQQQQLVGYFASQDDLVDQVVAALYQYLLDTGRPGRIPRDLPPPVPGFVGREQEVAQLLGALRSGQSVGLSTLVVGLGGVGKSALAAEALHRLAATTVERTAGGPGGFSGQQDESFPGGITWVRCDGQTGLDGWAWVADQILGAWGVRPPAEALRGVASSPEAQATAREQVVRERLERLPGRALVLLDNVEVDFPLERTLTQLAAVGVTLLVTARHRTSLPGLRVQPLDVLDPPAAVALFEERYTAQGGDWDETRDTAVAHIIVEALGRLALAIELAAARAALSGMRVGRLATELQQLDVLVWLRDPLNDAASVRYSFSRTLALLTPAQRIRFGALSLLDGPDWPRPVVEVLLDAVPPPGMEGASVVISSATDLDRLTALSLVSLVVDQAAQGSTDVARVRLHPLLQAVAVTEWEQQSEMVQKAGLQGLMEGVQTWAEAHAVREATTYAVLERDEALLTGALRRAAAAAVELRGVLDTAFALGNYLDDGGHWRMGVEVWTLALGVARETGDRWNEGTCFTQLGNLYNHLGDNNEARRFYEQALAVAREVGDRVGEGANLLNVGDMAEQQGSLDDARRLYEQALAVAREVGDREFEADILNSLGSVAYEKHDYVLARCYHEQALVIAREVGNSDTEAYTLADLANQFLAEGDLSLARGMLYQALPLARTGGNRDDECYILLCLAEVARREGQWEVALHLLEDVWALNRVLGSRENDAEVYAELARLQRDQGQLGVAHRSFEEALAIFERIGQVLNASKVHAELDRLEVAQSTSLVQDTPTPRWRWPWQRRRPESR